MSILTEQQLEHIFTTWEMVKDVGFKDAGMIMFSKLFEIKPSLQDMFSFKSQDLTNNELLEKHAVSVMETIDTALNLIKENEIETLVSTLIELGIAHSMNKVTPKHFAPVGQALIHALGVAIQDKFTDEVRDSWIALYKIVQLKMEEGMAEGEDL